jgi:hypothetical protein
MVASEENPLAATAAEVPAAALGLDPHPHRSILFDANPVPSDPPPLNAQKVLEYIRLGHRLSFPPKGLWRNHLSRKRPVSSPTHPQNSGKNQKEKYERKTEEKYALKDGQNAEGVDFVLGAGRTLAGILVDLNSKKLSGWYVNAQGVSKSPNARRSYSFRPAQSGSDGRFRVDRLGQEKIYLQIPYNGNQSSENSRYVSFRTGEITPGDQEQIFILPVGGTLQGRVLFEDTKVPATDAKIGIYSSANPAEQSTPVGIQCILQNVSIQNSPVQSDGSFRIADLPVAKYTLVIQSELASGKQVENIFVDTSLQTDVKDILLARGVVVTGRLVDPSGKPYYRNPRELQGGVLVMRSGGEKTGVAFGLEESGAFELASVPTDAVSLVIIVRGFMPTHINPLRLAASGPTDLGDIRLNAGETVKGKLSGPKGEVVKGAQVVIMTKLAGEDVPSGMAQTDDKAEFTASGCTVGPATLRAYAQGATWVSAGQMVMIQKYEFTVLSGGRTYIQARFPASNGPAPGK